MLVPFPRACRSGVLFLLLLCSCTSPKGKQSNPGEAVPGAKSPIAWVEPGPPPPVPAAEDEAGKSMAEPATPPAADPLPTAPASPPRLDLRNASYGPIEMGMPKAEVRKRLAEMGHEQLQELPMGRDRSLLAIRGINFRFTKEDVLYEIYTLNRGVPMEGGFRLGQSIYAEYEDFFGPDVEISPRPEGGKNYRLRNSDLELLLLPLKHDPDRVFSILLKRGDLR